VYCDHCRSALRNDEWYRDREKHFVESFEKGYSVEEIATAYGRPVQWTHKTIIERLGKDLFTGVMQKRASLPEFLEEGQVPAELEEHEYDNTEDSR